MPPAVPHAVVRPPPIAILIAITAIGPLALNIFLPSLPGLVRVFDTDYGTAQLALTLYLVGIACGQLIYGPLSDRFGRRPVLLSGLGVFVTSVTYPPNIDAEALRLFPGSLSDRS